MGSEMCIRDSVMTHDNTGAVIPKFKQIGATSIADPAQPVFAIDHDIQNTSPENLAKYAKIEAFAPPSEDNHRLASKQASNRRVTDEVTIRSWSWPCPFCTTVRYCCPVKQRIICLV